MHLDKELILATKPYAREIRWKSWFHTLTGFGLLIGSIVGTYIVPPLWGKLLCSLGVAAMLSRVFMIFHDYQHHAILQRSYVANFLFTLYGVYMITPPSIWKRSHDFHHNNNSKLFSASIGSFPIMTKHKFMTASKKERFEYLAIRHPLNMFFAYITTFMYGLCVNSFLSSPRRHWDSLVVLIIHFSISIFLIVYFGWLTWLLSFSLPFFLSHMLGSYLFYAQHNFPGVQHKSNVDWSYASAALESSSYLKVNAVLNWITANIGYHHVHHLNSRIPFYRLPEVMAKIPALQKAKQTTLNPSDIIKCLRLKVWDPELNRMIGFSEMEGLR